MAKRIADKGSSEAFLRANVDVNTDECIDWPYRPSNTGYGLAVIGGVQKPASRWMCILAHGEPTAEKPHAAHSCGRPICVNPRHLRWASPAENAKDRLRHGTENIGERNGRTSLTERDVLAIRSAPPRLAPLVEKYGMTRTSLSRIRSGKRWAHVGTQHGVEFNQ